MCIRDRGLTFNADYKGFDFSTQLYYSHKNMVYNGCLLYTSQAQLDLFETANIRLEVPYRCNQKEWKPTFPAFAKARKKMCIRDRYYNRKTSLS